MANSFETEYETPEMENLTALAENLVYRLPGCADVMLRKTIQDVYRDFCRRSCCLSARRSFVLDSSGVINVSSIFGGVIDCIAKVIYNGNALDRIDYKVYGGRIEFSDPFIPSADATTESLPEVEVFFIEIPKINSEQIPSFFIQKYGDAICSGVLYRLMSMTGKAWTDAQQAVDEKARYENAVCEARMCYYAQNNNGKLGMANEGNESLI